MKLWHHKQAQHLMGMHQQDIFFSCICRFQFMSAGLSLVSESCLIYFELVWGDLALLHTFLTLLRPTDSTGMCLSWQWQEQEVTRRNMQGFLRSSMGTPVSSISFYWPKQVACPRPESRYEEIHLPL